MDYPADFYPKLLKIAAEEAAGLVRVCLAGNVHPRCHVLARHLQNVDDFVGSKGWEALVGVVAAGK